jgi:hypothetical protein
MKRSMLAATIGLVACTPPDDGEQPPAGDGSTAGDASTTGQSSSTDGDEDPDETGANDETTGGASSGDDTGDPTDPNAGEPLEIDCTDDAFEGEDLCSPDRWLDDTVHFGEGPSLAGVPGFAYGFNSGSVDGLTLYVGAHYGFDTVTSVTMGRKGVVLGIDLVTGDRELVAGELFYAEDDPRNVARGTHTRLDGSTGEMGHVMDVRSGADGMLYALTSPDSADHARIVRVDPSTGDSVQIWDNEGDSGQCAFSPTDDRNVLATPWSMDLADDGGFYLTFSNNPAAAGLGIMKVSADGSACEFVMRNTSSTEIPGRGVFLENPTCAEDGPSCPTGGQLKSVRLHDGSLWTILDQTAAIYRIDPATGDHERLIGGPAPEVGSGEAGAKWMAFDSDDPAALWTIGDFIGESMPIRVDRDLALAEARAAEGALRFGSEGPIWRHPTRPLVIVADGASIVLCESPLPSENCNNFSR